MMLRKPLFSWNNDLTYDALTYFSEFSNFLIIYGENISDF